MTTGKICKFEGSRRAAGWLIVVAMETVSWLRRTLLAGQARRTSVPATDPFGSGCMDIVNLREPVSAWSHGVGLLLALPGTLLLWRRSGGDDPGKRLSLLVYGLSLVFCYAASTLYHGVRLPADRVVRFARLDCVGIFGLIAGSYTPLAWCLLRGRGRWQTLAAVWGVAAVAALLIATGRHFSQVLSTCVYLGLGWGVVACYREFERAVSRRAMLPIAVGGLAYSVGAVLNLFRWPALWTGIFGTHELFHLFVLAGSLAHYQFMLKVIVPFVHEPQAGSRGPSPGGLRKRFSPPGSYQTGRVERSTGHSR